MAGHGKAPVDLNMIRTAEHLAKKVTSSAMSSTLMAHFPTCRLGYMCRGVLPEQLCLYEAAYLLKAQELDDAQGHGRVEAQPTCKPAERSASSCAVFKQQSAQNTSRQPEPVRMQSGGHGMHVK